MHQNALSEVYEIETRYMEKNNKLKWRVKQILWRDLAIALLTHSLKKEIDTPGKNLL